MSDLPFQAYLATLIKHEGTDLNMQSFDNALVKLYEAGKISLEEAMQNADSKNNVRLRVALKEAKPQHTSPLSLQEDPPVEQQSRF